MKVKTFDDISFAEKLARWQSAERVLTGLPKHVREQHWGMEHWGVQTECGTVACAAGHCGLDPWFIKRGFKLLPIKFEKLLKEEFGNEFDRKQDRVLQGLTKIPETLAEANPFIQHGQGAFANGINVEDFFGMVATLSLEMTIVVLLRMFLRKLRDTSRVFVSCIPSIKRIILMILNPRKENAEEQIVEKSSIT